MSSYSWSLYPPLSPGGIVRVREVGPVATPVVVMRVPGVSFVPGVRGVGRGGGRPAPRGVDVKEACSSGGARGCVTT